MPLVQIQILEGRSEEQIDKLMKDVTDTISNSINAPKENIRVVVSEMPKTHYSIAGKSAKEIGR